MIDLVLLAFSLGISFAYLCRLDMLDWKVHRFDVILFYVGCIGALMSSAEHAWVGTFDLQDMCVQVACACWILTSYKTWKTAPPEYIRRRP
jgi:hypothetical protein